MVFRNKSKPVRLTMIGLDIAGKTSIICKLQHGQLGSVMPTEGFLDHSLRLQSHNLDICDAGGQDRIRPLWCHYVKSIDGLIFVVDSTDHERFEEAKTELHKIVACESDRHFPILIMANKRDLPAAADMEVLKRRLDVVSLTSRKWHVQPSSAKTGEGLKEGFKWLLNNKTSSSKRSSVYLRSRLSFIKF